MQIQPQPSGQLQSGQPWQPQTQWQQPPYPPPMIQPPAPKPRRRLRKRWIALSVIVLIIVIAAIAGGLHSSPTTSTTPIAQPKHSATQPTLIPSNQPTTQPTDVSIGSAILGAEISTFEAKYGKPRGDQGGSYTFSNGLSVLTDGSRAIAILTSPPGNTSWTETEAFTVCLAFAPSDAHYQRTITIASPPGLQRVYFSLSLASMLPSGDFTDEHGNADKPGTFGIVIDPDISNSSQYLSCSIQAGLQQV